MSRVVNGVTVSEHPNRVCGEIEDLKGRHFGHLVVIEFDHKDNRGRAMWKCLCDCGKTCVVRAYNLKQGTVISCGHVNLKLVTEHVRKLNYKHGASNEPWFSNYESMLERVSNPNDNDKAYYNSKRIKGKMIEQEWVDDPWAFYNEIGDKPGSTYSIDRINPDLGYIKGNVRWATKSMQSYNRHKFRTAKNKYKGVRLWPKGQNRRVHDKYEAVGTVNKHHVSLGYYYVLNNALRRRYDFETKYGIYHTFERPKGNYEKEPEYQLSENPGINWSESRHVYRVSLYIDPKTSKYLGTASTIEEGRALQEKARKEYQQTGHIAVDHELLHRDGIIGIDPQGNEHYYPSIVDANRQLGTHANLYRRLKDGQPFTRRRSKLYGWRFKYVDE